MIDSLEKDKRHGFGMVYRVGTMLAAPRFGAPTKMSSAASLV